MPGRAWSLPLDEFIKVKSGHQNLLLEVYILLYSVRRVGRINRIETDHAVGFGFFCLFLIAAIVACIVSGRKARLQDAESLRAIGGIRFTQSKASQRADKREREELFRREKERLVAREKVLDEELLNVGETVRKPPLALARKQVKSETVKVARSSKDMMVRTPRKSSLPSAQAQAQAQAQVKRRKSTSKDKERQRVSLERRERENEREKAIKRAKEVKKSNDKTVRRK
jgi:hypothetical protein